jgi:hypothetical protein
MQQKFDQNMKKFKSLTLYHGYNGMVKITSHATVPLRVVVVNVVGGELMQGGKIKSKPYITLFNIRDKKI